MALLFKQGRKGFDFQDFIMECLTGISALGWKSAAAAHGLGSGRKKQGAGGHGSLDLARAFPHQTRSGIPLILVILYFNIVQLPGIQADASYAFRYALLHPAVDDKLAVDPDTDAII